jgi:hypothetical protein
MAISRLRQLMAGCATVLLALTVRAGSARAEPLPVRVDYGAPKDCPAAGVFIEEIQRRTNLARLALAHEEARGLAVRIARSGSRYRGLLTLVDGANEITRDIEGQTCEEVVVALALVTALALDPNANLSPKPAPAPRVDEVEPAAPAPPDEWDNSEPPAPPEPPPFSDRPSPRRALPRRWLLGARAASDLGLTPRALLGGDLFAELRFGGRWRPSIRLAVGVAATGTFDAGRGGVSFVRALGRLEVCAFAVRPVARLSLAPCVNLEAGALDARGIVGGSLTFVREGIVPWVGAGLVPRFELDLGRLELEARGGPVLPAVRRTFVFENPVYAIYSLPAVTWTTGVGMGVRVP